MRPLLALAIACVLLAAIGATTAHAETFAGEHPASQAVAEVVVMATDFWAARDVTGCPAGVTAMQAPNLDGGDTAAFGRGGDCEMWITDDLASDFDDRDPSAAPLRWTCTVIFHEVGHALGLPHSLTGLMSVVPDVPWDCRVWARDRIRATKPVAPYHPTRRGRNRIARRTKPTLTPV